MINHHDHWMQHALSLANTAAKMNEVPVGAVIVLNNEIIGEGFNQPIHHSDPTAHAEIVALRAAANAIGNYRIVDATLYVTLEPCVMCVGAMIHARIKRLVFGAYDPKSGAVNSIFNLLDENKFNHKIEYQGGLLHEACGGILREFFKIRRDKVPIIE